MATNYTTKTAALRATKADINKLDAKKVLLNGKNILDYISDSEFDSYDTRDPQLKNDELDIWNTTISLSDNGHIEVKPFEHTYEQMTNEQQDLLFNNATQVINNEVFDENDNHLMYWQTDGLTCSYYYKDEDNDGYEDAEVSVFWHYFYTDDSLLSNQSLTVFDSDLSNLTDGYCMFSDCSNLTTFTSDLSSLTNGSLMFYTCSNLTTFTSDLSSLTVGDWMFYNTNLESFSSDLSSLTDGYLMFGGCPFNSFNSNLSSLTIGEFMFSYCETLESFSSDLSSLTDSQGMFLYCYNLKSFSTDLSSLTNGNAMFNECSELTTFSSDLSSLTVGSYMFDDCSSLTTFTSDLSSLTNGKWMFNDCKLNAHSVANIIHTLPQRDYMPDHDVNGEAIVGIGCLTIGLGCNNTAADQLLFAQECDCETWQELLDEFSTKNWIVDFQCNGRPTTYDMRRGETLPIYAKLEEVIMPTDEKKRKPQKEHKPHCAYTSADGSKFYNIRHFHSTNGSTEGYDVFSSLEEAISTYNVTPKN